MPRKQTSQRSRVPKPPIMRENPRAEPGQKRRKQSGGPGGLDALSIAERQYPNKPKIRRNRLGDGGDDEGRENKRRRITAELEEQSGESRSDGSDGDGHQWKLGEVDSENDSEVDSDEAMGESDEDMFEGFAFRGSSRTARDKLNRNRKSVVDEGFGEEEEEEEEDEEGDLGEDAVDLSTTWDMNTAEEDGEHRGAGNSHEANDHADNGDSDADDDDDDDDDDTSDDNEHVSGDESGLSLSDDEASEEGFSKLQNFIASMETDEKAKRAPTVGQEQAQPTEYGVKPMQKLMITDLLPSISDPRLKTSLKHMDSNQKRHGMTGAPGKLEAPLPKRQQDKLDRAAAYEKSKETLNRWLDTVKANRRAEHLSFPLVDTGAQPSQSLDVAKPQTDLEGTVHDILVESGLVRGGGKPNEGQVQEYEELQERKLPIEEVRARRAELRKHRDLLFREEVRAKRIKKIKSKAYRRVHRRERDRKEGQERQALLEASVDLEEENRETNERRRAEARMSTKHRDSKWAKSLRQTGRTAWDEEMRQSAVDLAQTEEELRRRIEGKRASYQDEDDLSDSSESESDDDDPWREDASDVERNKLSQELKALRSDGDDEGQGPHAKLLSMKFMQNADAARKERNDAEIKRLDKELNGEDVDTDSEPEEVGRRKFGSTAKREPKNEGNRRNEFEEAVSSDDEEDHPANSKTAAVTDRRESTAAARPKPEPKPKPKLAGRPRTSDDDANEGEENPWLLPTNKDNWRAADDLQQETLDITLTEPSPRPSSARPTEQRKMPVSVPQPESDSDSESSPAPLFKNHDLVKKAFAGDDVVQDFEEEKEDIVKEEGDQVIDNTLPGWGSWTGEGVNKKQQKRQNRKRFLTTIEGVKPGNRKDAKLSRVIINEKRIQKVCGQARVKAELFG